MEGQRIVNLAPDFFRKEKPAKEVSFFLYPYHKLIEYVAVFLLNRQLYLPFQPCLLKELLIYFRVFLPLFCPAVKVFQLDRDIQDSRTVTFGVPRP